ncbi:hypothetical protein Pr1d_33630 [Bythopirellula goksoeyrii]|uniref:Uncharacterized protein n=1 Tax=Bythopirellula goksoeyrii TaxID=1400387 RepID=A0A5B9QAF9_9BACT|nr:hypothetical protein Pr1d_33630 [Bythopirellula goksoeyrii]
MLWQIGGNRFFRSWIRIQGPHAFHPNCQVLKEIALAMDQEAGTGQFLPSPLRPHFRFLNGIDDRQAEKS